jgi:hypothetical protein
MDGILAPTKMQLTINSYVSAKLMGSNNYENVEMA